MCQLEDKLPSFIAAFRRGNGVLVEEQIICGLCMDEIEIRKGLLTFSQTGSLIGLIKGPITVQNVEELFKEDLDGKMATKVMMTFLVTLDGTTAIPLCWEPTKGSNGLDHLRMVSDMLGTLTKYLIKPVFVSTDGITQCKNFVDGLSVLPQPICFLADPCTRSKVSFEVSERMTFN